MKLIQKIFGKIQNANKDVEIALDGKNLIIAGGNGSGKTSFTTSVFDTLQNDITYGQLTNIATAKQKIHEIEVYRQDPNLSEEARKNYQFTLEGAVRHLASITPPINLEYDLPSNFIKLYQDKKATLRFFASDRQASITSVSSATASQPSIQSIDTQRPLGNNLEQHLVNLRVRSALAAEREENSERRRHANDWIVSLTENLKYLFEDPSTELIFDADQLRFYIYQEGKQPTSFQSLSSGYRAILDIYADLLMHTEYTKVKPSELTGVVIVDEIDAHLHVSLQRKILPFFTTSFPQIQFIVTTHSPFVLTSVDDAVIFDMTTGRIMSDLSMYSYESVVEGLLGVLPISKILEDRIKKLTKITSADYFELQAAENLLNTITPYVDVLDPESEMFYHIAAGKIIKLKSESK